MSHILHVLYPEVTLISWQEFIQKINYLSHIVCRLWTTYNIIKVTVTCNLCKCNDIIFIDNYNFRRPSFIKQPTSLCNIIIKLLTIQNDNIHLTWEVYGKSELVSHFNFKFCQDKVPVPCISTCYKLQVYQNHVSITGSPILLLTNSLIYVGVWHQKTLVSADIYIIYILPWLPKSCMEFEGKSHQHTMWNTT